MRFLLILFFLPFCSIAQEYNDTTYQDWLEINGFRAFQVNEKLWGFQFDDQIVIPAEYDEVGNFNDGVCPVRKGDFWGAVNEKGTITVPIQYDLMYFFKYGQAIVMKDSYFQLIDTSGKVITKEKFDEIFIPNNSEFYIVKNNNLYGTVNLKGEIEIPLQYEFLADADENKLAFTQDSLWGFLEKDGSILCDAKYYSVTGFRCGTATVKKSLDDDFNTVNNQGVEIEEEDFKMSENDDRYLGHGLYAFTKEIPNEIEELSKYYVGIKDKNGNVIVPLKYDYIGDFHQGYAVVALNFIKGLIDTLGNEVIPLKYTGLIYSDFSEGLLNVMDTSLFKYGFVNANDEIIIPFDYDYAFSFSQNLAVVNKVSKRGDYYFYINHQNKRAFRKKFDYANPFQDDGKAVVFKNGKGGMINLKGKTIIPFEYDGIHSASEGLIPTKKNNKYGFINEKNELIIDYRFDHVFSPFKNGVAIVANGYPMNYIKALIDKNGNELTPFKYESIQETAYPNLFQVMVYEPSKRNPGWRTQRYGLIDIKGNEVVPPIYDSAFVISENEACVSLDGEYKRIDF